MAFQWHQDRCTWKFLESPWTFVGDGGGSSLYALAEICWHKIPRKTCLIKLWIKHIMVLYLVKKTIDDICHC